MKQIPVLLAALAIATGCKKESTESPTPASPVNTTSVLDQFAANVAQANYTDLAGRAVTLRTCITTFISTGTDADLSICRQGWRDARRSWESSEGLLFGPVSTENIDPRIDTWPVDFNSLESQLSSGNAFTAEYINGLDDALKGFHPIEYLIFGQSGDKSASSFTAREREYLTALADNLVALTGQLATQWDPSTANNYTHTFTTAGAGNVTYPTQRTAFEEMVNAMAGICDEVANGKMSEPLLAQDPSLEESPFARNSIIDFTNNIRSVENVYLGRYTADGAGLEDLVRQHDLQLDALIKQHIAASISALSAVTAPFGEAIITQQVQVQQAITEINALATVLNEQLLPFVQEHTN